MLHALTVIVESTKRIRITMSREKSQCRKSTTEGQNLPKVC